MSASIHPSIHLSVCYPGNVCTNIETGDIIGSSSIIKKQKLNVRIRLNILDEFRNKTDKKYKEISDLKSVLPVQAEHSILL